MRNRILRKYASNILYLLIIMHTIMLKSVKKLRLGMCSYYSIFEGVLFICMTSNVYYTQTQR